MEQKTSLRVSSDDLKVPSGDLNQIVIPRLQVPTDGGLNPGGLKVPPNSPNRSTSPSKSVTYDLFGNAPKLNFTEYVEVKQSNVPSIGKGLFATKFIPKGSPIAEFRGRLVPKGQVLEDKRSNINFPDNTILVCDNDNPASFANDAIYFPGKPRPIYQTLESTEPFYRKHATATVNAEISNNIHSHRAWLVATIDINSGDEIFCHYGFLYWFIKEMTQIGFCTDEEKLRTNGFPEHINTYPAFFSYVRHLYPDSDGLQMQMVKSSPTKVFYVVSIKLGDDQMTFPVFNFSIYPMTNGKINPPAHSQT